jgi:hypothetical protein
MADPARRAATYDDILAAPPHSIAQLVDGELHVQPRPAGPHGVVTSGLGGDLVGPFQRGRGGPGGWIEAFRIEDGSWLRLGAWTGAAVARIPPFDAIELELGPLWVAPKDAEG